ncbi:MAG: LysM peptidoglycan-binding domain-containing protein [bacterium]|nr:LysM peptidoglycan-binding domain-containing protein [bacterium]
MGQLEKYGLYVLCLLIFLILGVTLWGSGNVNNGNGGTAPVGHLNAGGDSNGGSSNGSATGPGASNRVDPVVNNGGSNGAGSNGGGSGSAANNGASGNVRLPNFRELLTPGSRPSPIANHAAANRGGATNASHRAAGNQRQPVQTPPKPAPKPAPVASRPTYKIQRGDTYESIARERFQTRSMVSEIARLNPRLDPLKLRPGLEILMPTKAEAETFLAGRAAKRAGVKLGNTYTIKKGDTLIGIAKRELGSERRLREIQSLNPGVDPASLRIGASLRMPKK